MTTRRAGPVSQSSHGAACGPSSEGVFGEATGKHTFTLMPKKGGQGKPRPPGPAGCQGRLACVSGVGGLRFPRTKHSCRDPVPGGPAPPQPHSHPEQPLLGLWARRSPGHTGCSQVGELIDKVRAVFVETLGELSWMDEASKKKAQEKVGRLQGPGRGSQQGGQPGGAPGHHLHTHFSQARPGADSRGACGRRQDWKPSLGDPPAPRSGWGDPPAPRESGRGQGLRIRVPGRDARTHRSPGPV